MDQLNLLSWAMRHNIAPTALRELCQMSLDVQHDTRGDLEGAVQARVRLAEAKRGNYYYRNNRGAGKLENGNFIRWGLANDSARVGDRFKAGDLIGFEPTLITDAMVGSTIARFGSIEVKRSNWRFSGTKEELAQIAWSTLVNTNGGHARIVNHD